MRLTPSGSGQPVSPQIRGQPGRSRGVGQNDDRHAVAAANAAKSATLTTASKELMTIAACPDAAEPEALPADALPVDELPPGDGVGAGEGSSGILCRGPERRSPAAAPGERRGEARLKDRNESGADQHPPANATHPMPEPEPASAAPAVSTVAA